MAYIAAGHDAPPAPGTCVFCDLPAAGDDTASLILHRGRRAFVIMNRYPYNNGHLMVIPFAHVDSLTALDEGTLAEIMVLTQRSQLVIQQQMHPQGFNLGMNQGLAGGAGIAEHVHLHIVPRWVGDTNFMPVVGDLRVMPQHLDETFALLKAGFDNA
ncbi:MAG TPA: HIT domain-containing protein [Miltoncostaeaceae bacterium]|nr:HIT domain-containing protein [Miltoncostaeaceae bacterium]